jgi:hypothetical protein
MYGTKTCRSRDPRDPAQPTLDRVGLPLASARIPYGVSPGATATVAFSTATDPGTGSGTAWDSGWFEHARAAPWRASPMGAWALFSCNTFFFFFLCSNLNFCTDPSR